MTAINSNFQACLPSLLCRQISRESLVGASQGDAALFPHGSQEEDAVRKPLPPGSSGRTDCSRGTGWSSSLIRSSCDSGIFQKYIANFTQGVFKINLEVS